MNAEREDAAPRAEDLQPTRTTRRQFLGRLALGSLGLAALPRVGAAAPASPSSPLSTPFPLRNPGVVADEAYWQQIRAAFLLRDGIAPMNSANLCPAPRVVVDAVTEAMRDVDADVSSQNRSKYNALHETLRGRLAGYLGITEDELAIVRNTTEANNIIAQGIPLEAGDEVVLWDQNHQTNNVSWDVRASRYGFTIRRVTVPAAPTGPGELLEAFRAALTDRTKVIAFSDISNMSGIRLPAEELCRMGRDRGIHVHVDGAQSFGALQRDLHALGCDSYSSSAHKWFMGPKEAGILYVRAERVPEIWPGVVGVGWGGGGTPPAGARKFDTLGQRNDGTIAGFAAALDFHEAIGPEVVEARIFELASRLKEGLRGISGARAVTPAASELSAGVVIFQFEGVSNGPLSNGLYNEYRVAGATTGGMRLCPHIYNTFEDVDRAVEGITRLVSELRS